MDQVNKKPYETRTSKCNRGPFAIYISVGEDTFSGAYTNCQYSSDAGKCSLKSMFLGKYIRGSINMYKVRIIQDQIRNERV